MNTDPNNFALAQTTNTQSQRGKIFLCLKDKGEAANLYSCGLRKISQENPIYSERCNAT